MKLTIGMAHYDDFDGVFFTVQALKLYHDLSDCEILVVDNSPHMESGKRVEVLLKQFTKHGRYLRLDTFGTTQSRQMIFDEAEGDAVIVLDCHVLLQLGAIARLKRYYQDNPECDDLLSGPLLYDNYEMGWDEGLSEIEKMAYVPPMTGGNVSTHFDLVWREKMWGIWSQAWRGPDGVLYSLRSVDDMAKAFRMDNNEPADVVPLGLPWQEHEEPMEQAGFHAIGLDDKEPPFEIPANGLYLFSARRESWLGFNRHCRGFGGEEGYIHEKYRQAGRKCLCVPWLKANHRFAHGAPKYDNSMFYRARNYVLNFQELGLDLEPVHENFVTVGAITEDDWQRIIADPIAVELPPVVAPHSGNGRPQAKGLPQPPPEAVSTKDLFNWAVSTPRDMHQHLSALHKFAGGCIRVTEISGRRESSIALVASGAAKVTSYQRENDQVYERLKIAAGHADCDWKLSFEDTLTMTPIEETDLLFIDGYDAVDRVNAELNKHGGQVRRFLIFHDSWNPGAHKGMAAWVDNNPQWFVVYSTRNQYGFTVLGCQEVDRPKKPVHAWKPTRGPGTELKKLLARLGIVAAAGCKCDQHAATMDVNGTAWCREEIGTILDWLYEESQRRDDQTRVRLPWVRAGGKAIVLIAIRRAEKQERKRQKKATVAV